MDRAAISPDARHALTGNYDGTVNVFRLRDPIKPPPTSSTAGVATATASTASPSYIESPALQAWIKQVQALPADEQIKAVSQKLVELNPGFNGKLSGGRGHPEPRIVAGVVTQVSLSPDVSGLSAPGSISSPHLVLSTQCQ